jgi:hypothetical protein
LGHSTTSGTALESPEAGLARGSRTPLWLGALVAVAVFAGLCTVFALARQHDYWSDGRFWIEGLEAGRWESPHALYFPLAHLVESTLGRWLHWTAESDLMALSVLCGALAGTLFVLACMRAGLHWVSAVLGTLLLVSAPGAWFYSTCIEVHAPQLAASAGACLWAAHAWRRGRLGGNAIAPLAIAFALSATHLVGLSWTPALLLLTLAVPARRLLWRQALVALLVLAVQAWVVWYAVDPVASGHLSAAAKGGRASPSFGFFYRELVRPAGFVHVMLVVVAVAELLRQPSRLRRLPALLTLALFLSLAPYAFATDVTERGGYFLSLIPPAALWVTWWLDRGPRPIAWISMCVLIALQGKVAVDDVREWESTPVPAWMTTVEEAHHPTQVVLFTRDHTVASSFRHTRLVLVPLVPGSKNDPSGPNGLERLMVFVRKRAAAGARIGVLEDVLASEASGTQEFVECLTRELGEPERYEGSPCVFFGASGSE